MQRLWPIPRFFPLCFVLLLLLFSSLPFPVFAEETPAPYAQLANPPEVPTTDDIINGTTDSSTSPTPTTSDDVTTSLAEPNTDDIFVTPAPDNIAQESTSSEETTAEGATSPFTLGSSFTSACLAMSGDVGWLTCSLINLSATSLSGLYSRMIFSFEENSVFLTFRPTGQNSGVFRTWLYFLLIADLALVVFTVVLVVLRLTHRDSEEFSIQRLSPRLLAAAVLANLSFLICIILVDTANITGVTVRGFFDLFASAISSASSQITPNFGEIFPTNDGSALFSLSLVLLIDTFAYLLMWTILAVREALVTVLIFVTPLVFTILISPYWKKTLALWGKLLSFAILSFPICGLLLGLGDLLSTIFLTSLNPDNEFSVALAASLAGVLPYFLFVPLARPLYHFIRQISDILENPSAWMRRFVKLDASDNDYILENNQKNLAATLETRLDNTDEALATPLARSSETVKSRVDERNQTGQNLASLFTANGQAEREIEKAEIEEKVPIAWKNLVHQTSVEAYRRRAERRRHEAALRKAEEEQIVLLARSEEFALGTDYEKMLSTLASLANSLGEKTASVSALPFSDTTISPDTIRFGALARFLSMSTDGGALLSDFVYSAHLTPAGLQYFNSYRLQTSDVAVAMQKAAAVTTAWLNTLSKSQTAAGFSASPDPDQIGPRFVSSVLSSSLAIVAQSTSELSRYAKFLSSDQISDLVNSEYYSYILSDPDKWSLIESLPAYRAISEDQRAAAEAKTATALADEKHLAELKRQAEAEAEQKAERASYLRELEQEALDNPEGPEKIILNGKDYMVFRVPFDSEAFSKSKYNLKNWTLTPYGEPVYSEGTLRWYGTEGRLEEVSED